MSSEIVFLRVSLQFFKIIFVSMRAFGQKLALNLSGKYHAEPQSLATEGLIWQGKAFRMITRPIRF